MMDESLLDAKDIAGESWSEVIDDGLTDRRPGIVANENVHPGAAPQHIPPRALENPEKCRLIEMTEGVAIIGIHDLLDFSEAHPQLPGRAEKYAGSERDRYYSNPLVPAY
jgi:hypothetical protein